MTIQPYIFFYGRCQEALDFYKGVFGGSYEAMPVVGSGMEDHMPPDAPRDGIMHASFTSPAFSMMASDGRERKAVDPNAGNISLSITADSADEGKRLFDSLGAGGSIEVPWDDAPWGGKFGEVYDRFGTSWMITAS